MLVWVVCGIFLAITSAGYINLNASWAEPEGRFLLPAFSCILLISTGAFNFKKDPDTFPQSALVTGFCLIGYQFLFFLLA